MRNNAIYMRPYIVALLLQDFLKVKLVKIMQRKHRFKSVKAARPEDVIVTDANVETKEDKHKPSSRLCVPSGTAATALLTRLNRRIPHRHSGG